MRWLPQGVLFLVVFGGGVTATLGVRVSDLLVVWSLWRFADEADDETTEKRAAAYFRTLLLCVGIVLALVVLTVVARGIDWLSGGVLGQLVTQEWPLVGWLLLLLFFLGILALFAGLVGAVVLHLLAVHAAAGVAGRLARLK
jgi:hypothetical protein